MKYQRTTTRTKGFSTKAPRVPTRKEFLKGIEEHGRALIAVLPDDADDPRQIAWAYSVPSKDVVEPCLLTGYPSSNTAGFLLNALGDHFRNNGWDNLTEHTETEMGGFLGADGEFPIRARLLTETEREASSEAYTCQADDRLPIVLITAPDPNGNWPEDKECNPLVAWSQGRLEMDLGGLNRLEPTALPQLGKTEKHLATGASQPIPQAGRLDMGPDTRQDTGLEPCPRLRQE